MAFFFREPILVLLSSSEISKSDFRSLFSSLLNSPSKPDYKILFFFNFFN